MHEFLIFIFIQERSKKGICQSSYMRFSVHVGPTYQNREKCKGGYDNVPIK